MSEIEGKRELRAGDPITEGWLNALFRSVKPQQDFWEGYADGAGVIGLLQKFKSEQQVTLLRGIGLPSHSVFTISGTIGNQTTAYATAKKGPGKVLLTNRDVQILAGQGGVAYTIGAKPVFLNVDPDDEPEEGEECGPEEDKIIVAKSGKGLVCVTKPSGGRAWFIAAGGGEGGKQHAVAKVKTAIDKWESGAPTEGTVDTLKEDGTVAEEDVEVMNVTGISYEIDDRVYIIETDEYSKPLVQPYEYTECDPAPDPNPEYA